MLKISASLALITILGLSMVATVAQSYAQPSQDRKQKQDRTPVDDNPRVALGQEKRNGFGKDHGQQLGRGETQDQDDDDDDSSTGAAERKLERGKLKDRESKGEAGKAPKNHGQALGVSSVIIAKNSASGSESITLLTKSLKKVTVNITNETKIVKNGGTDTSYLTMFARLTVGDHAQVKFKTDGELKKATNVNAITPPQMKAAGNVTAKTTDSITIQTRSGETLSLTVTTTPTSPLYTVVKKGGSVASFADVEVGDRILTTFTVQPDGTLTTITIHVRAAET